VVTKEDIEHIAKLMRIDIENSNEYFERVKKVLSYFDILDKANTFRISSSTKSIFFP